MSQSFLGSNPGTVIRDVLAPALATSESVNNTTFTGDWVEVNFPGQVEVLLEIGAVGATAALRVEVQGADDDQGTNPVTLGVFDDVDASAANSERVISIAGWKRWMRVVAVESGANPAVITATVVPAGYHQGNLRTA